MTQTRRSCDPHDAAVDRRSFLGLATGAAAGAALYSPAQESRAMTAHAATGVSDIVMLDASELAQAIRARKLSCVEVMAAYLDHIDRYNPAVNAIVALQERAGLLAQARECDAELARGTPRGVLHGLPHAVKDLEPVKGIRTTEGSPIFKDFVPTADSLMVGRLRAAGAIFIGKTNAPEFGLGSHTYNQVYGITRNPYALSRSAGGSSGGAAVSLALRMVPLADGSDYAGSLRNPAGWNNVLGFRTSIGCVPADDRDVWLPSMAVAGPMARNIPDLALLLSVQAGYEPGDPLCLDGAGSRFRAPPLQRDFKGTRIAWVGDFGGHAPCEPGVLEVCRRALKAFESLGCSVEEAHPEFDLDALWDAAMRLRGWQFGGSLLELYNDPAKRALLKPEAIFEVELGMKQSGFEVTAASVVRTEWYRAVRHFLQRYDFLIAPTAQVFPFPVELHWPQQIAGHPLKTYHEWMKTQLLLTMAGCPALAVPAGFNDQGLPIGIEIVAPNRHELACLQLAHAYERATHLTGSHLPPALARG
jgi:amidase